MSTCGKLDLIFRNSVYLVFSSLIMQRRLMQTKLYQKVFYFVWEEASQKLLKLADAEEFFPSVYGTVYFDGCFSPMW